MLPLLPSQLHLYFALAPVAASACAVALWLLVRRVGWARARALSDLLVTAAALLLFNELELAQTDPNGILFWSRATYVAIAFCPVAWFRFALTFFRGDQGRNPRSPLLFPLLSLVPAATCVLAWTNPVHHLLWSSSEFRVVEGFVLNVVLGYGPWFWIHFAYSYGLYLVGCAPVPHLPSETQPSLP